MKWFHLFFKKHSYQEPLFRDEETNPSGFRNFSEFIVSVCYCCLTKFHKLSGLKHWFIFPLLFGQKSSRAGYSVQNPTRLKSRCWLCFFLEALWKNLLLSLCPLLAEVSSLQLWDWDPPSLDPQPPPSSCQQQYIEYFEYFILWITSVSPPASAFKASWNYTGPS